MTDTMRLWLLGFRVDPLNIEDDKRLIMFINMKDGHAAFERLVYILAWKGMIEQRNAIMAPHARLEFIGMVIGNPISFR